jgi:hypothetical protein
MSTSILDRPGFAPEPTTQRFVSLRRVNTAALSGLTDPQCSRQATASTAGNPLAQLAGAVRDRRPGPRTPSDWT